MIVPPVRDRQRHLILAAAARARLSVGAIWLRYLAVGGTVGPADLAAFLDGGLDLPDAERDRVALVVNEGLADAATTPHAPYLRPVRELDAEGGPLAALTALLRETHLRPAQALPGAISAATAHLGARSALYLTDYAEELLVPLPSDDGVDRVPLSIDSTLAGRAFRMLETLATKGPTGTGVWIPVVDGVDRLGVLELLVDDPRDVDDPTFRRQCWWLTHYLGHVLGALDPMGDYLDHVRRQRPRTIAAELVWQLLPPLTAGTDKVLVSGRLEPSGAVGGDVFDYALSDTTADVAIVDATGHSLRSGLAAATALAALRNARREGHGLLGQAETMHQAIAEQFGGALYATSVLGTLDLESGRFRYIAAGHPAPLLVRGGRVVRSLEEGRRPLLGLDARSVEVGEEHLQRGDTLVFYTDGIIEARDAENRTFGVERLIDLLQREGSDGTPLPEVVRRLCRRILEHQGGVLQDDATVLLVQWTSDAQADLEPVPRW